VDNGDQPSNRENSDEPKDEENGDHANNGENSDEPKDEENGDQPNDEEAEEPVGKKAKFGSGGDSHND